VKKPNIQQVCQAGSFLLCAFLALQITSGLEGTEFSGGWLTGPLLSMQDIGAALFIVDCRPDVCVPPSCCRNWACFISALFAALFVLYCSSPVRSNLRSLTPLGNYLRRMKAKLGPEAATMAAAHKIAVIFYTMIKNQVEYDETLWDARDAQRQKKLQAKLKRHAKQLGYELVPIEPQAA